MNKIGNQKISQFLNQLASKNPTPGGGAVAALAGAMAASLVSMVCGLTKKTDSLGLIRARADKLKNRLLELADEDCEAFEQVLIAYRSRDKGKIRKALFRAIAIPEKTARLSREVEKLARITVKQGNKNAVSDAKTAAYVALAAQKSASENIKINQKSIIEL